MRRYCGQRGSTPQELRIHSSYRQVCATFDETPVHRFRTNARPPRHRNKHSVTSRVCTDGGAMARDGKNLGRQRDARNEIVQICVSKARTCGDPNAETNREHVVACPIMLYVDRVGKGFRRLERWPLRRRDDDRFPGLGIAPLTRNTASGGEFPEPCNCYGHFPCESDSGSAEHGASHPLGDRPWSRRSRRRRGRRVRPC